MVIKITVGVFVVVLNARKREHREKRFWFFFSVHEKKEEARELRRLLLWQEDGVDVWENTTLGDGDAAHELVELFVVSDGELQVSWSDSRLLVVSCGVAGKFQDFGSEVLEDGCEVHWGTGTDSRGEGAFLKVSVDTSDWELESSPGGPGLGL